VGIRKKRGGEKGIIQKGKIAGRDISTSAKGGKREISLSCTPHLLQRKQK